MLSLELNQNIKIDSKVKLLIKPTNISICKNNTTNISIENKILCKISSIQKGELLCSVLLKFYDTTLESIITLNSLEQLDLKVDDEVIALVNSSDISILELLDV
jgi:molybdopterin-binding protein